MRQRIKWLPLMLCIWSAAAYPSSVIQHAEKLLASQQPEKAYQWLNQHQEQLNGSAKELYVYGLLALRLGHQQQAFITLEKVVALAPNNLAAQLDLAIAAIQGILRGRLNPLRRPFTFKREPAHRCRLKAALLKWACIPLVTSRGAMPG